MNASDTERNVNETIDKIMQKSQRAFGVYKRTPAAARALFLEAIAVEIEKSRDILVPLAAEETHLGLPRLNGELSRTTGQLNAFAKYLREGSGIEASIDIADDKPLIAKMLIPVGPVVVFGASNFPFAFSTAGGDTASVLASGSTVVIKGHPAHPGTSEQVFQIMRRAEKKCDIPENTIQHYLSLDNNNLIGRALVMHPVTKGVAFTGSAGGGKALLQYAGLRESPIPVFAEMGSVNPVVFLPDALRENGNLLAASYAGSITMGSGQFCTNPGLLFGIKSEALNAFIELLGEYISAQSPKQMLNDGIYRSYTKGLEQRLLTKNIKLVAQSASTGLEMEGLPTLARMETKDFLADPHIKEELFGPFSLIVACSDEKELQQVLENLGGQLTTSLMATTSDCDAYPEVMALLSSLSGRMILNGTPTGVEVVESMVHGGPFPATTDARFTSVGTTSIKRWLRPFCWQGFPDHLLPDELKDANPLQIWRKLNGEFTKESSS